MIPGGSHPPVPNQLPVAPAPTPVIQIRTASNDKSKASKKEQGPTKEQLLNSVANLVKDLTGNTSSLEEAAESWKQLKIPEKYHAEAVKKMMSFTLDADSTAQCRQLDSCLVSHN